MGRVEARRLFLFVFLSLSFCLYVFLIIRYLMWGTRKYSRRDRRTCLEIKQLDQTAAWPMKVKFVCLDKEGQISVRGGNDE